MTSLEGPPSFRLDGNEVNMNSNLIALASAATIAVTAVAIPNQAEARWRGGGWWVAPAPSSAVSPSEQLSLQDLTIMVGDPITLNRNWREF